MRYFKASAVGRLLNIMVLPAICLRIFLTKGDQSPRVSVTSGIKTAPVPSTSEKCLASLKASPRSPATPAVREVMLPGVSGLCTEVSEYVGQPLEKSGWKMSPGLFLDWLDALHSLFTD